MSAYVFFECCSLSANGAWWIIVLFSLIMYCITRSPHILSLSYWDEFTNDQLHCVSLIKVADQDPRGDQGGCGWIARGAHHRAPGDLF